MLVGLVHVARPKGEVVSEQLHDGGRVAVLFLLEVVQVGNGRVKGLFGEETGDVGRVEDFVVEDGVVEGEAEADRVRRLQIFTLIRRVLVTILRILNRLFSHVAARKFAQVPVIVAAHFHVKDLGVGDFALGDEHVLEQTQHVLAKFKQLRLDLLFVPLD